jgi:hypothetical protein
MAQPDDFMTVAEIVAILKLNQQTIRKLDRRWHAPRAARRTPGPDPPRRL